jgi:hypothetical protein
VPSSATEDNSRANVSVAHPAASLSHASSVSNSGPFPVPRLNLSGIGQADDDGEPPMLSRGISGRGVDGQDASAVREEQEQEQEQEQQEQEQEPQDDVDDMQYSDDENDGCQVNGNAHSLVALRALDAFSLLFSQINYSLVDGFAYISSDATSFTLQQLLAFCDQYLNGALSREEVTDLFQEMDAGSAGCVSSSDWAAYFDRVVAARDTAASANAANTNATPAHAVEQFDAARAGLSADAAARSFELAAAAASSGADVQAGDISAELLDTLQQLQQELVFGAAHALHLHSASSSQAEPSKRAPASSMPPSASAASAP